MTFLRACIFAVLVFQIFVSLEAANPILLKVANVNGVNDEVEVGEGATENSQDQHSSDDGDDDEVKAAQVDKVEYDNAAELAADFKSAEQEYQEDLAEKKRKHASGEDVEEEKEKFKQDQEDAKQAAAQEVESEAEQAGGIASSSDVARAEKAAIAEVVADHAETLAAAQDDAKNDAEIAMMPKFDFDSLAATLQGKDDDAALNKTAAVIKVEIAAKPVVPMKALVVAKPGTGSKGKVHSKPKFYAKAKNMAKVNAAVRPVVLAKANKVVTKIDVAVKPNSKKKAVVFMQVKHSDDVEIDGDQAEEASVKIDTTTSVAVTD